MRLRLTPQNTSFFDLFADLAGILVEGADLLAELLAAPSGTRKELGARIRDAEHRADEATHEIMRRLNTTFVTPFDRDDIYGLASSLDDCMDHMEAAGDLVILYKLKELPARVADQVDVLKRCAELTAEAMPRLRGMKDLDEYWVEINRLENQGDRVFRKLVSEILADGAEPINAIKTKEVVEALEAAADAFENVANRVETIFLKES